MAISRAIEKKAKTIDSVEQWPLKAAGHAFEVIPRWEKEEEKLGFNFFLSNNRTLAENCGADIVRVMTELRAIHSGKLCRVGIDGVREKKKNGVVD